MASLSPSDLKTGPDAILFVNVGDANGSQYREQLSQHGVETMDYDFFTPQSTMGAKFYYFRNVFHNWSDAKASEILRNLAPAMEPGYSALLIADYILPTEGAQLQGPVEDILMMWTCNALERTSKHYEALLSPEELALNITNISYVGSSEEDIIKVEKVKSLSY
ncbi:hypothetical protein F5X99DRAFT_412406 [Biscogniauxia marginata]|nr:hypothetical protein F5X99DRAFT_412406 [Biscogniauxia marginata]